MKRPRVGVLTTVLWLGLLTAIGAPVGAQEMSVGYQFQRISADGVDGFNLPLGIALDVSAPVNGPIELVGAFDWSRRHDTFRGASNFESTVNYYTFGGGIRLAASTASGLRPFVEALAGATRIAGSNSRNGTDLGSGSITKGMFEVGGGAAVRVADTVAAVGQFDYRRIYTEGVRLNSIRVVAGLRFTFR